MKLKATWTRTIAATTSFLLSSCAAPVTQSLAPHLFQPDITSLDEKQTLERFHFITTGCLKWAGTYPARIRYCQERLNREEGRRLGSRIAEQHPDWPAGVRNVLREGVPIAVGMTKEQVIMTMGEPHDKNLRVSGNGTSAQWVYRTPNIYVYFDNGVVRSFKFD